MRDIKAPKDWSSAALKLVELRSPRTTIVGTTLDGHDLPDVDLDALCDAIFADINNGFAPQFFR